MKAEIKLEYGKHNGEQVVFLHFEKDFILIAALKTLKTVRWSRTNCCWYILLTDFDLTSLLSLMKGLAWIDYSKLKKSELDVKPETDAAPIEEEKVKLSGECIEKLDKFEKWLLHRRYSDSTVKTYLDSLKVFMIFILPKSIKDADNSDMVRFVNEYIIRRGLSFSYQNQVVNACKLFYRVIVQSTMDITKLERPKRQQKLPNVLDKSEVKAILESLSNYKHRAMLSLIYACGLRRGELLNLEPSDINSRSGILFIRQAKGRKDRIVPISGKIIEILREYYKIYKPKRWLFEGQKAGEKYTGSSLQEVLKNAVKLAKINKPVALHWLRHCYATHLLESGTDLRYVQELLGHKSSKTTEIYTHVRKESLQKIKSPFDSL